MNKETSDFVTAKFIGWVEDMKEPGKYGTSFCLRNYQHDSSEVKYPTVIGFSVSSKKLDLVQGILDNDKIEVDVAITGSKGVSQKTGKPYQINKLMVTKLRLIESSLDVQGNGELDGDEDIPF